MTGPECYQEALRLLEPGEYDDHELDLVARDTARAQVFATLALAAATALSHYSPETGLTDADRRAWYVAASEGPAEKQRQRETDAALLAAFAAEEQS